MRIRTYACIHPRNLDKFCGCACMHIAGRKWQKREKMERIISVATFRVCLPASPCVCTYEGFSSHETKASRVIEPEEGGRKKKCDGTYYLRSYFRFLTYSMLLKSSLRQTEGACVSHRVTRKKRTKSKPRRITERDARNVPTPCFS